RFPPRSSFGSCAPPSGVSGRLSEVRRPVDRTLGGWGAELRLLHRDPSGNTRTASTSGEASTGRSADAGNVAGGWADPRPSGIPPTTRLLVLTCLAGLVAMDRTIVRRCFQYCLVRRDCDVRVADIAWSDASFQILLAVVSCAVRHRRIDPARTGRVFHRWSRD